MKTAAIFQVCAIIVVMTTLGSGCTDLFKKDMHEVQVPNTTAITATTGIDELKTIITSNPDPDIREDGVMTLTRKSVGKQTAEDTIAFLKANLDGEEDENVQGTMLASIGLLRSEYPLAAVGKATVTVNGPVRRNGNFSINVSISTGTSQKNVRVGIPYNNESIELTSPRVVTFDLEAGQPMQARFEFVPHENGNFVIPVMYIVPFDSFDYEKVERSVFLTVNDNEGSYLLGD